MENYIFIAAFVAAVGYFQVLQQLDSKELRRMFIAFLVAWRLPDVLRFVEGLL